MATELSDLYKHNHLSLTDALKITKAIVDKYRTFVLVEGKSDMLALTTLAKRLDINLDEKHVAIIPMSGVTNIGHFLDLLTAHQQDVNIAGLYDIGEEHHVRSALEEAGFDSDLTSTDLESLGFYVCNANLEDELIRAVGIDCVLEIADEQGELWSWRTFQTQPEWRGRDREAQIRRWIGTKARRNLRYAKLLTTVLNLTDIPKPLEGLLMHISHIS